MKAKLPGFMGDKAPDEKTSFELKYQAQMTQLVKGISQVRSNAESAGQFGQAQPHPINERGAFTWEEFDLSGTVGPDITGANGLSRGVQGYKLLYLREGSAAGGRVDIDCGGQILSMAPGDKITGYFDRVRFARSSLSVVQGYARFLIVTNPQADFEEWAAIGRSENRDTVSYAATANASTNTPSAATDGLALLGAKAVRVTIAADSTRTFSGAGTIRFWYYNPITTRWALNVEADVDLSTLAAATYRDIVLGDRLVALPAGRIFVECLSVTVSAGALTVYIERSG